VIDAMATLAGATERACATPATYASCLSAMNSARDMLTVAVNVTTASQSRHTTQGPPSGPVYPASHAQSTCPSLPAAELENEGHAAQLPDPTMAVYVPALHATHANPSAPANPTEHRHRALPEEACELAGHVSHAAVPIKPLNVPASHATHASPSEAAVCPTTHVQFANSVLPSDETVFEGHASQSADPTVALYDPAPHAAHCPSAPMNPGRHAQYLLPSDETVFEGHATQLPDPAVALNVPATHATQAPPVAPKKPAGH